MRSIRLVPGVSRAGVHCDRRRSASPAGGRSATRAHPATTGGTGPCRVRVDRQRRRQPGRRVRPGDDGTLSQAGIYPTAGLGGSLDGAVVDRTASQGALDLDPATGCSSRSTPGATRCPSSPCGATNFSLDQVVPSGGSFPVASPSTDTSSRCSTPATADRCRASRARRSPLPLPGSNRALGLDPNAAPEFTHTPGQVTFSPDGSKVLVTTKAGTNAIDVFSVGWFGLLSPTVVTTFTGARAVRRDVRPSRPRRDRAGAGTNSVATATLRRTAPLPVTDSDATCQAATCWIVRAGDHFYASNAGSASSPG